MNAASADAALRLLDREIWIVTSSFGDKRGGLVATWVSPASIDRERPVLLAGIAPIHFTAELIDASGAFTAHLLREDQSPLAWDFARDSGRDRDKLSGLSTHLALTGSPVLADCLAWFACRVIGRYDAGDRLFFWGEVTASEQLSSGPPLRQQTFLRNLTPDQLAQLSASQQSDAIALRPQHEAWRDTIRRPTST